MPDESLVCRDCGATFVFTEDEQAHFRARGFTSPPRRCKPCRAKNRRRQPAAGRGGNVRNGDGRAATGEHAVAATAAGLLEVPAAPRPPRRANDAPLHATTCSLCGATTEVPFVPDGVRPVFCLPCLKQQTR